MKLYERDYFQLTKTESDIIDRLKKKMESSGSVTVEDMMKTPRAHYFHASHFPNNMLDTDELWDLKAKNRINSFAKLLNKANVTERDILTYINANRSFFLVASLLGYYDFGHHGGFLFPEFPFSTNYVADYLVIGKNSGGHEFIFIELEAVNGKITTKDGNLGEAIRRGIKQIEDWNHWLQKHYPSLKSFYDKYRNHGKNLPDEFLEYDKSRIHFIVVAGRREHYNDATYRKRRNLLKENNIRLLHYDNLIDAAKSIVKAKNYCSVLTVKEAEETG
jgi:hypothetical protein